jgi:penicillin amidase
VQGDAGRARDALLAWDERMDAGSSGAAVYGYFWQALAEALFKDKVPASLWNTDTALDDNSRLMNTVLALMKDPGNPFWDNPATLDVRESREDILKTALQKAARAGVKAQGPDMKRWSWGRVHTATFRNQTFGKSGIRLIERIFNRGPVPVGGGMQQVISNDWSPADPFNVFIVSSMRQVIDLSDFGASAVMNATGQSGHAFNRHYDDMISGWAHVTYHPTFWDPAALRAGRTERLLLEPSAR